MVIRKAIHGKEDHVLVFYYEFIDLMEYMEFEK